MAYLDSDDNYKFAWFKQYAIKNYLPHLENKEKSSAKILEIGCNKGYLLKVFLDSGFEQLFGIDLSQDDIAKAKFLNPKAKFECVDAFAYLDNESNTFDVVILKAVLEHIPKDEVMPLLKKINASLNIGGIIIVDVPNMDWLFASHERYMDFTHEVGFTKESLGQLFRAVFAESEVLSIDNYISSSFIHRIKQQIGRFCLGKLLSWADPEGASNPIWCRSIVGVGHK